MRHQRLRTCVKCQMLTSILLCKPRVIEKSRIFLFNIFDTLMTCSDNERCSKSNVQRKFTKQKQSEHGPLFKKI